MQLTTDESLILASRLRAYLPAPWPAAYFRTSPGRYFHDMVAKTKAGELNLARTIWGPREAKAPKPHMFG